jgi:hypothetical protein
MQSSLFEGVDYEPAVDVIVVLDVGKGIGDGGPVELQFPLLVGEEFGCGGRQESL